MEVQEMMERIGAMGFEEVTASYNREQQTQWFSVFVGPGLPVCCCEDEQGMLTLFVFLRHTLGLREKRLVEGVASCEHGAGWSGPQGGGEHPWELEAKPRRWTMLPADVGE